jgi:bifunctional DNase/RNase
MQTELQLVSTIILEDNACQIIVLKEKDGQRQLRIGVDVIEAAVIDRELKKRPTLRPPTHKLLASVIQDMGGVLERVVINDLQDETFFALLHIRQGNRVLQIDTRPSDAVALGISSNVPIFAEDKVFEILA